MHWFVWSDHQHWTAVNSNSIRIYCNAFLAPELDTTSVRLNKNYICRKWILTLRNEIYPYDFLPNWTILFLLKRCQNILWFFFDLTKYAFIILIFGLKVSLCDCTLLVCTPGQILLIYPISSCKDRKCSLFLWLVHL